MNDIPNTAEVKNDIVKKLSRYFGCAPAEATPEQAYKAAAITVLHLLTEKRQAFKEKVRRQDAKKVYYLSMEFLVGRSLKTNLANLGLTEAYRQALASIGFDLNTLYECEPDAGLGNGGLGRLAACFMDALAELAYPATGFSICYDLRFPELFRCLALQGAEVFLCPANFTFATGQLHWQLLLRARAAENGAYLIGAAQCGQSPTYRAYGHSMIVDPWGKVLAEGGQEPGVVMAEIDLPEVAQARRQLGMLQNRREDLYRLSAERVHFDQEEEEVGRSV